MAEGRDRTRSQVARSTPISNLVAETGAVPWSEVLAITRSLVGILREASAFNSVHGDISPSTVWISVTGEVFLAKPRERDALIGPSGQWAGGPNVDVAPELLHGGAPGPASDIHGIGLCAFALVTGRPARLADPNERAVDVLARLARTPVVLPVSGASPAQHDVLERCLSFDPAGRPALDEIETTLLGRQQASSFESTQSTANPTDAGPSVPGRWRRRRSGAVGSDTARLEVYVDRC